MNRQLHKNDDGTFCISEDEVWRPGAYADEATARAAFDFSDETLRDLQEIANERQIGEIQMCDLLRAANAVVITEAFTPVAGQQFEVRP